MKLIKYIYNYLHYFFNIRYKGYYTRLLYYKLIKIVKFNFTKKRNKVINFNKFDNDFLIDKEIGFLKVDKSFLDQNLSDNLIKDAATIFNDNKNLDSKNPRFSSLLSQENIKVGSPLYKLATNKKIINIVTKYLGVIPVCTYINIWHSPKKDQENFEGSQLMHLDHEDFFQVKLFFFCKDVDMDTGPLITLKSNDSKKIQKKFNYNLKEKNKRVSDKQLKEYEFHHLVGGQGDLYLIDTSQCFHAGSRKSSKDRLVIMIQYLTPYSYMRKLKNNNSGFKFETNKMSDYEKTIFSFS